MFIFVDVQTQQFPDYVKSVPTLVIDQNMIKADDVFGYLNNMVEQIFEQNPELKQKYHPEQQQGQSNNSLCNNKDHLNNRQQNLPDKPGKGPDYDPVDDLVGWCPDGGCSFSTISEQNDDCSKQMVSLEDRMFSTISRRK